MSANTVAKAMPIRENPRRILPAGDCTTSPHIVGATPEHIRSLSRRKTLLARGGAPSVDWPTRFERGPYARFSVGRLPAQGRTPTCAGARPTRYSALDLRDGQPAHGGAGSLPIASAVAMPASAAPNWLAEVSKGLK
jgi:hypothetical protein